MSVSIDASSCKGCESCTLMCPTDAIHLDQQGKAVIDPAMCIECGACVSECDFDAIDLGLEPVER